MKAALLALLLVACGGNSKKGPSFPFVDADAMKGAWPLLPLVPAGAERVIELDLERLRQNPTIGPILAAWGQRADVKAAVDLGFNPLLDADLVVMATYSTAAGDQNLFIIRGHGVHPDTIAAVRQDASRVDDTTLAFGAEGYRQKVVDLARAEGPSIIDEPFIRLRNASFPKGAPGASLRMTARFGFGRRVTLAGELGIDEMPGTVSVWGDVADDVAVVAILGTGSAPSAKLIGDQLTVLWNRELRRYAPGAAFGATAKGPVARLVLHLGPRALAELGRSLQAPP